MSCTYYLEKGVPEPKIAVLEIIKVNSSLQRATSRADKMKDQVLASCEINFSMHFGEKFREETVKMVPAPGAIRTTVHNITYYA